MDDTSSRECNAQTWAVYPMPSLPFLPFTHTLLSPGLGRGLDVWAGAGCGFFMIDWCRTHQRNLRWGTSGTGMEDSSRATSRGRLFGQSQIYPDYQIQYDHLDGKSTPSPDVGLLWTSAVPMVRLTPTSISNQNDYQNHLLLGYQGIGAAG